jgi:hypothetical protein
VWKGDPDGTPVGEKFYIDRIGMPCGNSDDICLPGAVDGLARPAIYGCEVIEHIRKKYNTLAALGF